MISSIGFHLVCDPIPGVIINDFDILVLCKPRENSTGYIVFNPGFEFDNDTLCGFVVFQRDFDDFFNESDAECANLFKNLLFANGGIHSRNAYGYVGFGMLHLFTNNKCTLFNFNFL